MPTFVEVYTDQQRDAVAFAWNDRIIRPAARVAELARRGELTAENGETLPPFDMPEGTIRSVARHARKRRRGKLPSKLADAPPRDAVENLRRRLVAMTDRELERLERKQRTKPTEPLDTEHTRQLARAVLEIARLPGPSDPRPPSKDTRDPETGKKGPDARGGLAGDILRDHRSNGTAPTTTSAQPRMTPNSTTPDRGDTDAAQHSTQRSSTAPEPQDHADHDSPGAWVREQAAGLLGA